MVKNTIALLAAVAVLMTLGCVITTKHTIDAHITVDIRHIEKQADNILDYVEGKTNTLPGAESEAKDKKPEKARGTSMLRDVIEWMNPIRTAYAAELKQSSPAVKDSGCAGESNRGVLELRPCDKLTDAAKKNEAQQLIAAENADRKALYKEVAELNRDQNVTVSAVERVFAQKRLERAQPGQVFQLPEPGDDFDAFKKSDVGKKLGAECKPGAWVTTK
ncbi:MAG: DUF1318 domain-containing protein [Candidatus Hydrogenedentes bacterium]|nr:DUF1318 domain-containing protein [Candidatus Hydrogenedentota bacterium]